jgi:hypothetical protein
MKNGLKDITGQKFGWLLVLRRTTPDEDKNLSSKAARWQCICEACGTLHIARGTMLRRGAIKSCGCKQGRGAQDGVPSATKSVKIGDVFGSLTIESFDSKEKNGKMRFLCRCDCGAATVARGTDLKFGNTTSCGCKRINQVTWNGKTQSITAWAKELGMPPYVLSQRISRSCWPIDKIMTEPYSPRRSTSHPAKTP